MSRMASSTSTDGRLCTRSYSAEATLSTGRTSPVYMQGKLTSPGAPSMAWYRCWVRIARSWGSRSFHL